MSDDGNLPIQNSNFVVGVHTSLSPIEWSECSQKTSESSKKPGYVWKTTIKPKTNKSTNPAISSNGHFSQSSTMTMLRLAVRAAARNGSTHAARSPGIFSVSFSCTVLRPMVVNLGTFGACSPPPIQSRNFMSSSSTSSSDPSLSSPEAILDKCAELYESLTVLNDSLGGTAIPPPSDRATSLPFCLLVGNHSSGKSSFINYILQRNIQKAGVAPTDDTFTVIAPGEQDADADGPTMVRYDTSKIL
jgi:hypothetical protein